MNLVKELRKIARLLETSAVKGDHDSFDWKETEKADEWVTSMTRRGFSVWQFDGNDDQIYLAAVKGNINDLEKYMILQDEWNFQKEKYKQVFPGDLIVGFLPKKTLNQTEY